MNQLIGYKSQNHDAPITATVHQKIRKNTGEDTTRRLKRKTSNNEEENAQFVQYQPYEKALLQIEVDALSSKVAVLQAEFRSQLMLLSSKKPSQISLEVERHTLLNTILDGELEKNRAEVLQLVAIIEDEKKKRDAKGKAKMFPTPSALQYLPPTSAPISPPASGLMNYPNGGNDGRYFGRVGEQAAMVNQFDGNLLSNLYSPTLNQQQQYPVTPLTGVNQVNLDLPQQQQQQQPYVIQPQPSVPVSEPMPLQQQLGLDFDTGLQAHGNLNDLIQNVDLDEIGNFIINPNSQHWFPNQFSGEIL